MPAHDATGRGTRRGQLGHGARRPSRADRSRRAAVGARRGAGRRDRPARRQRGVSAGRLAAADVSRRAVRSPTRCTAPNSSCRRSRRTAAGRSCARPRRCCRRTPPSSARPRGSKPRRCCACRRSSPRKLGGDRPVVVLSGPSFAIEVAQQLPTVVVAASTDGARDGVRAGGVPRSVLSALRVVRRRRRRNRRRAEERHRHRRRRRRGARPRPQRAGGADHARPRGDLASGAAPPAASAKRPPA